MTQARPEHDRFLTVEDLAERYRTVPSSVHGWLTKRTGPRSVKVGKRRLFRLRDVLEWEAAHTDPPERGGGTG